MKAGEETMMPPVAVGGVGGSGTRLIANILHHVKYHIGDDLNESSDNLWFPLLFKRPELRESHFSPDDFARAVRIFRSAMIGDENLSADDEAWVVSLAKVRRSRHSAEWLAARAQSLLQAARHRRRYTGRWGWKAPNTHVFLDRLRSHLPRMRYIHVMRNGLDMAYSDNHNQLKLWGRYFFGHGKYKLNPYWSLKYWCLAHRRIEAMGSEMPGDYLLLNYDAFCANPSRSLRKLLIFLNVSVDEQATASLLALVHPPHSIGRFKSHGLGQFDPDDVAYVRSLRFDCSTNQGHGKPARSRAPGLFSARYLRLRRGSSGD